MIKWSILQEAITILKMYVSNNRVSNHMRQKLIQLQGEIDESTIILETSNPSIRKGQILKAENM